jgi:plasmid stability protein
MSEVLVRNLDEAVIEQLKARARGSGRSLQAELKLILEQATRPVLAPAQPSRAEYRALADRIRDALGDRTQADSTELLAEDRAR